MSSWPRRQRGDALVAAGGGVSFADRLAIGVWLMLAGAFGNADVVFRQALSSEGRQEPVGATLATMTHEDVGTEKASDHVNITDITIGSDIGADPESVFMQAVRVCGLNPDYRRPFLLGRNCMVGPVNDPDSGSDECRVLGYTFICIEE